MAPISRASSAITFAVAAVVLVIAAFDLATPTLYGLALVPIVGLVVSRAATAPTTGRPMPAAAAGVATVLAAAASVSMAGGVWWPAAAASLPVVVLLSGSLGRVVAMGAVSPLLVAVLIAAPGDQRVGAATTIVAVAASSEIIVRAGRWLIDGAREQRQKLSELGNLLRAADVLAALDDDDRAAATIGTLCRELLGADAAALVVRSDAGRPVVATRDDDELLPAMADGGLESIAARSIGSDRPITADPSELHAIAGVGWFLAIPLRGTSSPMGAVTLAFRSARPEDPVAIDALCATAECFARQAGLTLERIRSLQRVADAALRDPLTGVGNRRAIESVLSQLRPGDAVAMFDLDHFKVVNDTDGHAGGDRVLVAFARHLRSSTPHDAVVGRWGGEEFLVVLRSAHHRAGVIVEEVRTAWIAGQPRTTFSAGVSLWSRGLAVDELVEEADQALYAAKHGGRNRVVTSDGLSLTVETATQSTDTPGGSVPTPVHDRQS